MGRFAQLNVNKGPAVKEGQKTAITEVAVGKRKEERGAKGERRDCLLLNSPFLRSVTRRLLVAAGTTLLQHPV